MRATNRRLFVVSAALAAATVIAVPLAIRAGSGEPAQGGPPQKVWGTPLA